MGWILGISNRSSEGKPIVPWLHSLSVPQWSKKSFYKMGALTWETKKIQVRCKGAATNASKCINGIYSGLHLGVRLRSSTGTIFALFPNQIQISMSFVVRLLSISLRIIDHFEFRNRLFNNCFSVLILHEIPQIRISRLRYTNGCQK